MHIVRTLPELRAALSAFEKPAFVPTMGNLHDGHLALLKLAKPEGDVAVASIFVNRLQFLPHEDFDSYPRTWEADCAKLEAVGCDVVFAPREADLYPEPQTFKVHPDPRMADILEGQFRPGFFVGVATVVMKLFQAVFAGHAQGVAAFGKKDYQQLMVIRQLVRQFALPIDILAGETQRTAEGLAMSSRNGYLSEAERAEALQLSLALRGLAQSALSLGQALPEKREALEQSFMSQLQDRGWKPDYLTVRRRVDLQAPTAQESAQSLVVLGAAKLGGTRLIDNFEI